jgi:hypothetical protein
LTGVEQSDRAVQFFHLRNMTQVFARDHLQKPARSCAYLTTPLKGIFNVDTLIGSAPRIERRLLRNSYVRQQAIDFLCNLIR